MNAQNMNEHRDKKLNKFLTIDGSDARKQDHDFSVPFAVPKVPRKMKPIDALAYMPSTDSKSSARTFIKTPDFGKHKLTSEKTRFRPTILKNSKISSTNGKPKFCYYL